MEDEERKDGFDFSANNATYLSDQRGLPLEANAVEIPAFAIKLYLKHKSEFIDDRELVVMTAKVLSETLRLYDNEHEALQMMFLNASVTNEVYNRNLKASHKKVVSAKVRGAAYYTGGVAPGGEEMERRVKEAICGDIYQTSLLLSTNKALTSGKKIELMERTRNDFGNNIVEQAESWGDLSGSKSDVTQKEGGVYKLSTSPFKSMAFVGIV